MPRPLTADITEVWRRGNIIGSWLLDLTATALSEDPKSSQYSSFVEDSSEGRWSVSAAIDETVPLEMLASPLHPLQLARTAKLR
jgi:6-phosphogluconate dehydrogenase